MTLTMWVLPLTIAWPRRWASSAGVAASITRRRVPSLTGCSLPLMTRDTVAIETLACLATSVIEVIVPVRSG
jgi:hypothetical protein